MTWTSFAAAAGGASAGLTGLIFIVVSFRFDTIATSQELRSRAAQTVSLFMTATVAALLVAVPQPRRVLGAEILALAVVAGVLLFKLDATARQVQQTRPSIVLVGGLGAFVTTIAASGLLQLLGAGWGMYLYVPGALIALVMGALSTWIYLTGTVTTTPSS